MKKIGTHKIQLPDGLYYGFWTGNKISLNRDGCNATIETSTWNSGKDSPVVVTIKNRLLFNIEFQ